MRVMFEKLAALNLKRRKNATNNFYIPFKHSYVAGTFNFLFDGRS